MWSICACVITAAVIFCGFSPKEKRLSDIYFAPQPQSIKIAARSVQITEQFPLEPLANMQKLNIFFLFQRFYGKYKFVYFPKNPLL